MKQKMLEHLSTAIAAVQATLDVLTDVHPIAADTDVYKQLTVERQNLRNLLVAVNKLRLP